MAQRKVLSDIEELKTLQQEESKSITMLQKGREENNVQLDFIKDNSETLADNIEDIKEKVDKMNIDISDFKGFNISTEQKIDILMGFNDQTKNIDEKLEKLEA